MKTDWLTLHTLVRARNSPLTKEQAINLLTKVVLQNIELGHIEEDFENDVHRQMYAEQLAIEIYEGRPPLKGDDSETNDQSA